MSQLTSDKCSVLFILTPVKLVDLYFYRASSIHALDLLTVNSCIHSRSTCVGEDCTVDVLSLVPSRIDGIPSCDLFLP